MQDRDTTISRIHEIDSRFASDPSERRFRMERQRTEFLVMSIAERLCARYSELSPELARIEAERILKRAWHRAAPNDPTVDRRTDEEERLLTSAKVAWHKLLKAEGIAAARPRSKRSPLKALTGAHARLRRLKKLKSKPAEGAAILREYVASYACHLEQICAHAKKVNPHFVSPELEQAITELRKQTVDKARKNA